MRSVFIQPFDTNLQAPTGTLGLQCICSVYVYSLFKGHTYITAYLALKLQAPWYIAERSLE